MTQLFIKLTNNILRSNQIRSGRWYINCIGHIWLWRREPW